MKKALTIILFITSLVLSSLLGWVAGDRELLRVEVERLKVERESCEHNLNVCMNPEAVTESYKKLKGINPK